MYLLESEFRLNVMDSSVVSLLELSVLTMLNGDFAPALLDTVIMSVCICVPPGASFRAFARTDPDT